MCPCPSRRSELDLAPHLRNHGHVARGFSCHGMSDACAIDSMPCSYDTTALADYRNLTVFVGLVCEAHETDMAKHECGGVHTFS